MSSELKILARDVEASVVPVGTKVTLLKGEQAHITQSLGGSYTVIVNGNMFRIAKKTPMRSAWKFPPRPPPPRPAARSRRRSLRKKSGNRSRPATTRKFPSTSWTSA